MAAHVLVLANVTAASGDLIDAIRLRAAKGPIDVTLLMPGQGTQRTQAQAKVIDLQGGHTLGRNRDEAPSVGSLARAGSPARAFNPKPHPVAHPQAARPAGRQHGTSLNHLPKETTMATTITPRSSLRGGLACLVVAGLAAGCGGGGLRGFSRSREAGKDKSNSKKQREGRSTAWKRIAEPIFHHANLPQLSILQSFD
mgnify:CR=1 FL=1